MPLFGKHREGDNDRGQSASSRKSKRISDAERNQRHKKTLSQQKDTERGNKGKDPKAR